LTTLQPAIQTAYFLTHYVSTVPLCSSAPLRPCKGRFIHFYDNDDDDDDHNDNDDNDDSLSLSELAISQTFIRRHLCNI